MRAATPHLQPSLIRLGRESKPQEFCPDKFDYSLTRLGSIILQSEVCIFTERSALPAAFALIGFADGIDAPPPHINTIKASGAISCHYFESVTSRSAERSFNAEVNRLTPVVRGKSVCVVDQFAQSGRTGQFAARILYEADASDVTYARGYWYMDAGDSIHPAKPGVNPLNTVDAHFAQIMYDIGILCAKDRIYAEDQAVSSSKMPSFHKHERFANIFI